MKKLSFFCGLLIASGSLLAQQYTINTIGGIEESPGWSGDLGPATSAQINKPIRVAVDSNGNVYITDLANSSVRVIYASSGIMNSITGNGSPGFSGDGGTAIGAQLSSPNDIAFDAANNLYIADTGNSRVRIVSLGTINTFAGTTRGVAGANLGDGGLASAAQFILPTGVTVDKNGNVYVADIGNATVRKITPNGMISTVAGTGFLSFGAYSGEGGPATKALLGQPYSLTTDSAGNLYIVDTGLSRLFRIGSDGVIHTVLINFVAQNCVIDGAGNIYAADYTTNTVQKILPGGTRLWIGGDGVVGWSGDGGPGTSAQMAGPYGVALDKAGNVYVAESTNAIVRELLPVPFSIGAISNAATNQPFEAAPAGYGDASVPIAPGEIVTIFGSGLGPASLVSNAPKSGVYGTQLAGTSVTFNGTAAPIIYASSTIVSAIVPYEVNGLASANVVVTYQGNQSAVRIAPVAPTAPGVFTLDSTGAGQALAVNLDGSGTLNSIANPIATGSYILLYATGEGITTPAGVDGKLAPTSAPFPMPVNTVAATIGGIPAVVGYAGAAPGFVAGVMQVNLQIPVGVPAGNAAVQLTTNFLSSAITTIAVSN